GTPDTFNVTAADSIRVTPVTLLQTIVLPTFKSVVPAPVHVPPVIAPGPVNDDVTVSPAAATNPPPTPRFFSTVTVNVCGLPTARSEEHTTVIQSLTQLFFRLALSPAFASPSD